MRLVQAFAAVILLNGAPTVAEVGEATHLISYSGRLLDEHGQAVGGPVELRLGFFGSEDGEDALSPALLAFPNIGLAGGVFRLTLAMTGGELRALFAHSRPVYLQVKDETHGRIYRRQRFTPPADALAETVPPPAAPSASIFPVPAPL